VKRILTCAAVAIGLGFTYLIADQLGLGAWLRARVQEPLAQKPAPPAPRVRVVKRAPAATARPRLAHPEADGSAPLLPHIVEVAVVELPHASTGIVARIVSSSEVELRWGPPQDGRGVAAYEVVRDGHVLATSRARAFTDRSLAAWSEHCYAIRTLDGYGLRDALPGMACLRVPDTTPPTVPGGLVVESASEGDIVLAWEPSTDDGVLAGYEVMLDGNVVGAATWRSGFVSNLAPATSYCLTVRAFDEAGNRSEPSPPACARTLHLPRRVRVERRSQ
jgi:hypothetical protein